MWSEEVGERSCGIGDGEVEVDVWGLASHWARYGVHACTPTHGLERCSGAGSISPIASSAGMETSSSSSKVTVSYCDPSALFPLVSRDLATRLPLRNLNWHSHARPLRQIKSLHVDFVPDEATKRSLRANDPRLRDSNGANGNVAGEEDGGVPVKQRRHQIPGLKTSPYLHVYLLRCDDKDTYKASERTRLREWVKERTSLQGKKDRHDADEWLILHIVLPGTVAANEPRWRESAQDPDELKERKKSNIKLPGKSTRTVFDKLRSDFNDKQSPDRVAQVRLLKSQVPQDLLPTPAIPQTLSESAQERENAWADLVTKLKTLILIPFDARVRQYEDDIAEQEARRSLPGWNFCTFFIHKEGLAKALESVGLVEDALAIYDELNLGLETAVRDLAEGNAEGVLTSFEPATSDILDRIVGRPTTANGTSGKGVQEHTADLFSKDYRLAIVRSQISLFDFTSYIFSRQKALILRLAGALAAREEFGEKFKAGGEDLVLLAEVCWRTRSFVHNAARVLRADLREGYVIQRQPVETQVDVDSIYRSSQAHPSHLDDLESLVSSWSFELAGLVLDETDTTLLDPDAPERPTSSSSNKPTPSGPTRAAFAFAMGGNAYPSRSSSLITGAPHPQSSSGTAQRPPSSANQVPPMGLGVRLQSPPPASSSSQKLEEGTYGPQGAADGVEIVVKDKKPGLVELSAYRAELIMIRRHALEAVARRLKSWTLGWASAEPKNSSKPAEKAEAALIKRPNGKPAALDEPTASDSESDTSSTTSYKSIASPSASTFPPPMSLLTLSPSLTHALSTIPLFQSLYLHLTTQAIFHYLTATHSHTAAKLTGDIALLKYASGEYEAAREVLEVVVAQYGELGWSELESRGRRVWMQCLERLEQWHDGVRVGIEGLKKGGGALGIVASMSRRVEGEVEVGMNEIFGSVEMGRFVELFAEEEERDGFRWRFGFECGFEDEMDVDEVTARFVNAEDPSLVLSARTPRPVQLRHGKLDFTLDCAATALGLYHIDQVTILAGKLRIIHRPNPSPTATNNFSLTLPSTTTPLRSSLHLYPSPSAFDLILTLSKTVHTNLPRTLELRLFSGQNNVTSMELRLKPTTAGLRLHLADTESSDISVKASAPRSLNLGSLAKDKEVVLQLPYSLEQSQAGIALRCEVIHRTSTLPDVEQVFQSLVRLPSQLPLDVEVNDVFHTDAVYSTFSIKSATGFPLVLASAGFVESAVYAVEWPGLGDGMGLVMRDMPVTLGVKIRRKEGVGGAVGKKSVAVGLRMRVWDVGEVVRENIVEKFREAVERSELRGTRRLIVPILRQKLGIVLTAEAMGSAALTGEVSLPDYDGLGWDDSLRSLDVDRRDTVRRWLQAWHKEHTTLLIDINDSSNAKDYMREVNLPVEVPTLDAVFNASIALETLPDTKLNTSMITKLGDPIAAKLQIDYTRRWSAADTSGKPMPSKTKAESFIVEVQANEEVWLVGGVKRKRITLPASGVLAAADDSSEPLEFALALVPLKLGVHRLPIVEITPAPVEGDSQRSSVTCETHCSSAGQLITVVKGQQKSRVRIVEEKADGEG
ncbi:hypothetical protein LTR95_002679 [Oleoguttula sp. CCFEE 5521]